jgi:hypothetical protein
MSFLIAQSREKNPGRIWTAPPTKYAEMFRFAANEHGCELHAFQSSLSLWIKLVTGRLEFRL